MGRLTPVVVGTNPERGHWLTDCLATIPADRPVLIHDTGGYEIAALRTGCARFSRFLFLQDSVTITNPTFWDVIDASGPAWLTAAPPMYLGIHHRDQLAPVLAAYPATVDKETAIALELDLHARVDYDTLWPDVTDRTALGTDERHGRTNLLVGNDYFVKRKGTWR